ncbi:hypothetical protein ACWGA9_37915 [Streptomyces sp. NPDC054950]
MERAETRSGRPHGAARPGLSIDHTAVDDVRVVPALDEIGYVLVSALREWARDFPTTAALGIARSVIRFTVNVIPDPGHADTADTLETMRDERLLLAHAAYPAPVPTGSRTGRCTSFSVWPAR